MRDGFIDDERPSRKRARRYDANTSKRAAADDETLNRVKNLIYETLKAAGEPLTAEEINQRAGIDGQTGNPRYNELMEEGWFCLTGEQRENQSGKEANLWRIATPKEGAFLREQVGDGFPADNALVDELEDTPELDKIWPLLNRKQKRAYNGRIRKKDWDKYKKVKGGVKAYMRAYGVDDEDDSK